jgi:hypothetical protein
VPKKITNNAEYAESARAFIKAKRDEAGGAKPFYTLVYGRESMGNESITFNNQINRGNYSAEFIGLLVDSLELDNVTMGEFFKS